MRLSKLWLGIKNSSLHEPIDLDNFRQPGTLNSRLASWEPREMSLRWYKTFLNLVVSHLSEQQIHYLNSLSTINLGNPISVKRNLDGQDRDINLDYILSAVEMDFLKKSLNENINTIERIVEVGAGFGRTAHMILANMDLIQEYVILDFPEMLEVSSSYLRRVLPHETFKKVKFVTAETYKSSNYDLSIQIDGLQEMEIDVIDNYFESIFSKSRFCFLRNPVGKYSPHVAGFLGVEDSQVPWNLGKSQRIIDIWDLSAIASVSRFHDEAYTPENAILANSENCKIFPHYRMQFFEVSLEN